MAGRRGDCEEAAAPNLHRLQRVLLAAAAAPRVPIPQDHTVALGDRFDIMVSQWVAWLCKGSVATTAVRACLKQARQCSLIEKDGEPSDESATWQHRHGPCKARLRLLCTHAPLTLLR